MAWPLPSNYHRLLWSEQASDLAKLELSRAHTLCASWLACTWVNYNWLWVWLIGVAKTKATIIALVATAVRFLAKLSPFFDIFDSLVAITAR